MNDKTLQKWLEENEKFVKYYMDALKRRLPNYETDESYLKCIESLKWITSKKESLKS